MDTATQVTQKHILYSSVSESIAGTGAIIIAILGIVGVFPMLFVSVATIAIGASLLFEGGAIMSRISDLSCRYESSMAYTSEIGGGLTAETFAGLVGISLGILGLVGVAPLVLSSIAAIIFGAALIMGSGVNSRINKYELQLEHQEKSDVINNIANEAIRASAGVQFMIGLGAITLGILSLVGINPLVLTLVAMLGIGVSDLFNGSALSSRIMNIFS